MSNQYTVSESPSAFSTNAGGYSPQDEKLIRCIKRLCHKLKRANRLKEQELYIRLAEIAREREYVFDDDWAAMMRGLKPQKRKRKNCVSAALERWWW